MPFGFLGATVFFMCVLAWILNFDLCSEQNRPFVISIAASIAAMALYYRKINELRSTPVLCNGLRVYNEHFSVNGGSCSFYMTNQCQVNKMVFSIGNNWFEQGPDDYGISRCNIWPRYKLYFLEVVHASKNVFDSGQMTFVRWIQATDMYQHAERNFYRYSLGLIVVVWNFTVVRFLLISFLAIVCTAIIHYGIAPLMALSFWCSGREEKCMWFWSAFAQVLQTVLFTLSLRTWRCDSENEVVVSLYHFGRFLVFAFIYHIFGGPAGSLPYMDPLLFQLFELIWDENINGRVEATLLKCMLNKLAELYTSVANVGKRDENPLKKPFANILSSSKPPQQQEAGVGNDVPNAVENPANNTTLPPTGNSSQSSNAMTVPRGSAPTGNSSQSSNATQGGASTGNSPQSSYATQGSASTGNSPQSSNAMTGSPDITGDLSQGSHAQRALEHGSNENPLGGQGMNIQERANKRKRGSGGNIGAPRSKSRRTHN